VKIFLCWSGPLSRYIAEALRDWLPSVLQAVEPYVSTEDIYKGARWNIEVARELEVANYGILCLTADNIKAPWLNFEAGALSKSVDEGSVSPFLFNIKPSDFTGPLTQFQSTVYERDDVLKLIRSINEISKTPLDSRRLHRAFEMWWPDLQKKLDSAKNLSSASGQDQGVKRSVEEMIAELLDLVRTQQKTLFVLSQRAPRPSSSLAELEFLENLVEDLVRRGRLTSAEVVKAIPGSSAPSRRLRRWLEKLMFEVEPAGVSLPTEPVSADSKPPS
jgi:hypothetical protein